MTQLILDFLQIFFIVELILIIATVFSFSRKVNKWLSRNTYFDYYLRFKKNYASFFIVALLILISIFGNQEVRINTSIESLRSLLISYSTILPSILGIASAILIVGLNSVKSLISDSAFSFIFKKSIITNSSILFGYSVLTPLGTLLFLSAELNQIVINLTLLSSLLFVLTISAISVTGFIFIRYNNNRYALSKIFERLEETTEKPVLISYYDEESHFTTANSDPLISLKEAAIRSLENKNDLIFEEILWFLSKNIKKVVYKPDDYFNRKCLSIYAHVLKSCISVSIEQKNYTALDLLLDFLKDLKEYFSKKGIDVYSQIPIDECFDDICKKIVRYDFEELVQKALNNNTRIFEIELECNSPDEEDLWLIKIKANHSLDNLKKTENNAEEDSQWTRITNRYFFLCNYLVRYIAESGKYRLINPLILDLRSQGSFAKKKGLGKYQTFDILRVSYSIIRQIFLSASKAGKFEDLYFEPIGYFSAQNILDSEDRELSGKLMMQRSSLLLIELLRNNNYSSECVNEFTAIGRHYCKRINEDFYYELILFISKTLDRLREVAEEKEDLIKSIYQDLSNNHNSIIEFIKKDEELVQTEGILQKLNEVQNKFDKFTDRIGTDNISTPNWPNISIQ